MPLTRRLKMPFVQPMPGTSSKKRWDLTESMFRLEEQAVSCLEVRNKESPLLELSSRSQRFYSWMRLPQPWTRLMRELFRMPLTTTERLLETSQLLLSLIGFQLFVMLTRLLL